MKPSYTVEVKVMLTLPKAKHREPDSPRPRDLARGVMHEVGELIHRGSNRGLIHGSHDTEVFWTLTAFAIPDERDEAQDFDTGV